MDNKVLLQNLQINNQIMVKTSKFSIFLLATLASLSLAKTGDAQTTGDLTVVVDGLRSQNGQVCLRLYSDGGAATLDTATVLQSVCTKKTGSSVTQRFSGLKFGSYAVAVIDDENGDNQLNTNSIGIPTEGVATTINPTAPALTGPPTFKDASFSLTKDTRIKISITYL